MGGASAVSMVCGLIRGKLVAIILGVSGVGLWGIANQYVTLAAQIGGLGLSISGVKYVSEASGDEKLRREQEVKIFARHLGGWGGLLSLLFALPVCWLAFGSFENQLLLLIAAMAVPFAIIGGGWGGSPSKWAHCIPRQDSNLRSHSLRNYRVTSHLVFP